MEYYINWSVHTGRYLVKKVGECEIVKVFDTIEEAYKCLDELEK